jgi:hypothetical protein
MNERDRALNFLAGHRPGQELRVGKHLFEVWRVNGVTVHLTKAKSAGKKLYVLHVASLDAPFTIEVREVSGGSGELLDTPPVAVFTPFTEALEAVSGVVLAPPAGTLAYRKLVDELRASGQLRIVHGSASDVALKAEMVDTDAMMIFDLEPGSAEKRLARFLALWSNAKNPPKLYLAPKLGTNIDWLQEYTA